MPELSLSNSSVFLTGSTGVLGSYILKELLHATNRSVTLLVRAPSLPSARQRVEQFLKVYDPTGASAKLIDGRVRFVLGDIQEAGFGMAPDRYRELAESTELMIHCAASTNLFARYASIAPINVGGAENAIQFSLATPTRRMVHVSTYTVIGDKAYDRSVIYRESDFDIGQKFPDMPYQETKFRAERAVRDAEARGLVWTIVRPGQIYGEAATGRYPHGFTNVGGLFYDLLKTILDTRVATLSDGFYDITPVDYVARAVRHYSVERASAFETAHLMNPHPAPFSRLVEALLDLGYPLEVVDYERYQELILSRGLTMNGREYKSITTQAFRFWFQREQFNFKESAFFDTAVTRGALEPAEIRCPRIDRELIGTYIRSGIENGYFPAPESDLPVQSATVP